MRLAPPGAAVESLNAGKGGYAFSRREEPVFWRADHHISVLGHRLIAEALLPLVQRLRPSSPR